MSAFDPFRTLGVEGEFLGKLTGGTLDCTLR